MAVSSMFEHFKDLPDPRRDNRRHKPMDIMFITVSVSSFMDFRGV